MLALPRRAVVGVLAAAVLVAGSLLCANGTIPLPHAHAAHVQEPTSPIGPVTLRLARYNPHTPVNCSVTSDVTWNAMRIEADVEITGAPSEHFDVLVRVWKVLNVKPDGSFTLDEQWSSMWRHQNAPPHAILTANGWEVTQSNTYNLDEHVGLWRVFIEVTGRESGLVFTDNCVFRRV